MSAPSAVLPTQPDVSVDPLLHVALHAGRRPDREHAGGNLRAGRDQAARADHRPFADLCAVEDDAADADQRVVADVAAVQHDAVPDGDAVAHHGREPARVDVDDGVVLDAGVAADADALDVAAENRPVPDAAARADDPVADDAGARGDEDAFAELRRLPPERPDHAFSLLPGAPGGTAPDSPAGPEAALRMRSASPLFTRSSASARAFTSCESMSRLRRRPAPATSTLELSADRIRTTCVCRLSSVYEIRVCSASNRAAA